MVFLLLKVGVPAFFRRTYENDQREPDVPIVTKDTTPYNALAPAKDRGQLMANKIFFEHMVFSL